MAVIINMSTNGGSYSSDSSGGTRTTIRVGRTITAVLPASEISEKTCLVPCNNPLWHSGVSENDHDPRARDNRGGTRRKSSQTAPRCRYRKETSSENKDMGIEVRSSEKDKAR